MAKGFARYANEFAYTGVSGTNKWPATDQQMYFASARKTSPLVTATNSGATTAAVTAFTLGAPGVWTISAGSSTDQTGTMALWLASITTGNKIVEAHDAFAWSLSITREFDVNAVILASLKMVATTGMVVVNQDDVSFISFLYHGAF